MGSVEPGREDAESKLYDVAERQAGYFTASQAREAGYSHASQSHHHKAGHWLRGGWGIYRLAHFPHVAGEDFVRRRALAEAVRLAADETRMRFALVGLS